MDIVSKCKAINNLHNNLGIYVGTIMIVAKDSLYWFLVILLLNTCNAIHNNVEHICLPNQGHEQCHIQSFNNGTNQARIRLKRSATASLLPIQKYGSNIQDQSHTRWHSTPLTMGGIISHMSIRLEIHHGRITGIIRGTISGNERSKSDSLTTGKLAELQKKFCKN